MKAFESGMAYLRKEALAAGVILDSDNDDTLVECLAQALRDGEVPSLYAEAEDEAEVDEAA